MDFIFSFIFTEATQDLQGVFNFIYLIRENVCVCVCVCVCVREVHACACMCVTFPPFCYNIAICCFLKGYIYAENSHIVLSCPDFFFKPL